VGWLQTELGLVALAAMLSPTTLSFSVLALVLGDRPLRTGLLFYTGALGATLTIGIAAALVLGDAAASKDSTPKTWVAVIDVVAGVLLMLYVVRAMRRPADPERAASMISRMSGVASSPAIAIVAAGATLANPGGFLPLALKEDLRAGPEWRRVRHRLDRVRAGVAAPAPGRARDANGRPRADGASARRGARMAGASRKDVRRGAACRSRGGAAAQWHRRAQRPIRGHASPRARLPTTLLVAAGAWEIDGAIGLRAHPCARRRATPGNVAASRDGGTAGRASGSRDGTGAAAGSPRPPSVIRRPAPWSSAR
jgi:hypothetical protein